jgi:hypothetical protein
MSATSGPVESYHRKLKINKEINDKVQCNMTSRLLKRALNKKEIVFYDPADPLKLLDLACQIAPVSVIIDGAGTFNNAAKEVADYLLQKNSNLKKVHYHEHNTLTSVGSSTTSLKQTGFVYIQDKTRGIHYDGDPNAVAILTLSDRDGIRDFFQKEGRLRNTNQRYILALPECQKEEIKDLEDVIVKGIVNDNKIDSKDIFNKSKQELNAILRKAAKQKLLESSSLNEFLRLYSQPKMNHLFISQPGLSYPRTGHYYQAHKHLRIENLSPAAVLEEHKKECLTLAAELDLNIAEKKINKLAYTPALISKMPTGVASFNSEEFNMELQVEQEKETNIEVEVEVEVETESELNNACETNKDIGSFPFRLYTDVVHSLSDQTKIPFDKRIFFSDAFMPLSRNDNSIMLRKRSLFDESMYRVGILSINCFFPNKDAIFTNKIDFFIGIEDALEDTIDLKTSFSNLKRKEFNNQKFESRFFYDIRLKKIVGNHIYIPEPKLCRQILENETFQMIIAQIKFFDGQLNHYSDKEIEMLKEWINKIGKEKMSDLLLLQILRTRVFERMAFPSSQLNINLFNNVRLM